MQRQHTRIARAFHWSVLALYVVGVAKQLDDVSQLADDGLLLPETVFATVFLVIVIARYGSRRRVPTFHAARTPIDPRPAGLARALHRRLDLCFVVLSGLQPVGGGEPRARGRRATDPPHGRGVRAGGDGPEEVPWPTDHARRRPR